MKTKRNLILITFIFCGILSATAQSGKFYVGAKAGLGIPNLTAGSITTPLSEGYASRLGFYGGLVSELRTSAHFGFRAELNFSSQGGKRDGLQALPLPAELEPLWQALPMFGITPDEYMYASIKSEAVLNYIELPVLAKYRFSLNSRINFYMQAGPVLGFLVNAKNITSGSSQIYIDKDGNLALDDVLIVAQQTPMGAQSFNHTENITSDVRRFNIGGQGAIGFGLATKSGELFIEGGGNYGFIPVQKDESNGNNNAGAGTVTVGYLIHM